MNRNVKKRKLTPLARASQAKPQAEVDAAAVGAAEEMRARAEMDADMCVKGVERDPHDSRDFMYGTIAAAGPLPSRFEVKDRFDALNQGQVPACTAFAFVSHRGEDSDERLSTRYAMTKVKQVEGNMSYGATTRNQFRVGKDVGTCPESLHPDTCHLNPTWAEYNNVAALKPEMDEAAKSHKVSSFWRVNGLAELKTVLFSEKRSVVASMAWYSEFNRVPSGDIPTTYSSYAGGHAVKFKGYDDDHQCLDGTKGAVHVRNSWSKWWGKDGDFWLPYSQFDNLVWDMWASLPLEAKMPVDSRYGLPRDWQSYLRERSIAFSPWLKGKIGRLPTNREINALAYGYWPFEWIYSKPGRLWLAMTYPEARSKGLLNDSKDVSMEDEKMSQSAVESLTVRANLVASVSMMVLMLKALWGIDLGAEGVETIVNGVFGTIGLFSLAVSIWGRIRASRKITGIFKK